MLLFQYQNFSNFLKSAEKRDEKKHENIMSPMLNEKFTLMYFW